MSHASVREPDEDERRGVETGVAVLEPEEDVRRGVEKGVSAGEGLRFDVILRRFAGVTWTSGSSGLLRRMRWLGVCGAWIIFFHRKAFLVLVGL